MDFLLQKNLDTEFDNKDNIIKITNQDYTLSLRTVVIVDWEFKKEEVLNWYITLSFNKDYNKDPTRKIYYTYLNKEINPEDKHSVLKQIKNLFLDISNEKLILIKKDIDFNLWVRCEELIPLKNF